MDRVPVAEAVPWVVAADQVVAVVVGAVRVGTDLAATAHKHKNEKLLIQFG